VQALVNGIELVSDLTHSMKTLSIIVTVSVLSCRDRHSTEKENSITPKIVASLEPDTSHIKSKTNDRDWQEGFNLSHDPDRDSIWFKPVSYYLSDNNCSELASDFYYGRLKPNDDTTTDELLVLALTDNKKLRPFYRWCLNKTIAIQDGALGEHTGVPARKYAEKFPEEFFEYMEIDTSGEKLNSWISSIAYSGFYDQDDYKKGKEIQQRMAQTMKKNCPKCDEEMIRRIEKFTNDCFN